jgi:hypothetical protein
LLLRLLAHHPAQHRHESGRLAMACEHGLRALFDDGLGLGELGFEPGPRVGFTLGALLESVIEDPSLNRRDALLAQARELLA